MPNSEQQQETQLEIDFKARRRSDNISREEVELGDIWEFLHEMNLKLELHLQEYKQQQPAVKELIDSLNKIKGIKWTVLIIATAGISFMSAKESIVKMINSFLGR